MRTACCEPAGAATSCSRPAANASWGHPHRVGRAHFLETLTDREFESFHLIGCGRSTKEIAAQLHLSVNMKAKLRVVTSRELTRFAVRWVAAQAA